MNNLSNQNFKKQWYKKSWFIILSLILIYPLGLALMWGLKKWKFWVRVVITSICLILFISHFSTNNTPKVVYKTNPQDEKLKDEIKEMKSKNEKLKKKIDKLDKKIIVEKEKNKNKDESQSDSNSKTIDTNNSTANSNETSKYKDENNTNALAGASIDDKTDQEKEKDRASSRTQHNSTETPVQNEIPQQSETRTEVNQDTVETVQPQHFANCTSLRQSYPHGVPKGHPAYSGHLDRDKDGFACER